jgi:hypothetical protein
MAGGIGFGELIVCAGIAFMLAVPVVAVAVFLVLRRRAPSQRQ